MTLIYCTGWLSWRLFIWICCQHLLPSRLPSRESLELFILFRKIQQTATSKYQFSKTYWQSSLLYTIHIADPMFKYSGIYPTYFLHYEQDNGRRIFLLAGRKRKKCSTSTYVLSTDPTDLSRQGSSTLATLRSVQNLFFFIFIISLTFKPNKISLYVQLWIFDLFESYFHSEENIKRCWDKGLAVKIS